MRTNTQELPLRDLVLGFSQGRFPLPQFQRDYVWKPRQILNLLDSLARSFPVGGFYLWRPTQGTKLDAKATATGRSTVGAYFDGYLIDGQQRLTSLEAAFGLNTASTKVEGLVECYLDLLAPWEGDGRDTKLFVSPAKNRAAEKRIAKADATLISVSHFLRRPDPGARVDIQAMLRDLGRKAKQQEESLRNYDAAVSLLDHRIPVTTISEVADADVIPVFARLNKGGSSLRAGDVRAAELARGRAGEVLRRIREFVVTDRPSRLGFGFSFAFRALVVFHRESAQFSRLRGDWVDQKGPHDRSLLESWQATERAISEALEFVDTRLGWCRKALLPSANAMIVLAFALDKHRKIDDNSARLLTRWLCLTALRGVFQGSVESTIDRFIRAVKRSPGPAAVALVDDLKRDEGARIVEEDLRHYSPMWGAGTQIMMAWLVSRDAIDWTGTDSLLDLARGGPTSLPGGDLTVHHVVPRKLLADEARAEDANVIANYALVSASSNSQFGDARPKDVYTSLTSDQRERAAVQFFGMEAGDRMAPERYDEFLEWRAGKLADAWNDWLGLGPSGRNRS